MVDTAPQKSPTRLTQKATQEKLSSAEIKLQGPKHFNTTHSPGMLPPIPFLKDFFSLFAIVNQSDPSFFPILTHTVPSSLLPSKRSRCPPHHAKHLCTMSPHTSVHSALRMRLSTSIFYKTIFKQQALPVHLCLHALPLIPVKK